MHNMVLKRTAALLLLAALVLSLAACSTIPASPVSAPASPAAETPQAPAQASATPEPTPAPTPTPEPTPEPTTEPTPEPTPEPVVGEVLTDEDGDGVIPYRFTYKGSTVYALIVLDPAQVYVGTAVPEPGSAGGHGLTLDVLAEQYGAIAGINAGGFKDKDGSGEGWPPQGITYSRGMNFEGEEFGPVAGLDGSGHLWCGYYTVEDCEALGIRDGVSFGPYLVQNGVKADPEALDTGIGARTLVGQREDGAIVLVAIDGRQAYSIGLTYGDCIDIMADKFGCVNASNMDGGNSTCMLLYGEAVNRSSNQAGGTRVLPNAWLVAPLPEDYVKPAGTPDSIVIPENALGEVREYEAEITDEETLERLYTFSWVFCTAYYGYFGTQWYDRHYPDLSQYVAQDCELRERMDLAAMDRAWVNTRMNEVQKLSVDAVYLNSDGSYDVYVTLDLLEQSPYWKYKAADAKLRITVMPAPEMPLGFLALATY